MKVSLAKGTQDFLPAAALPRRHVIDRLIATFEQYGFEPLETPAFERIETLTGKYGEEGEKLIFKILKRGEGAQLGEADLALRYDLTVPLARVVAMYSDLPRPFKRYQIAPVWRAEKPQKGRFREFYQCDVDVAGSSSRVVEIELLTMIYQVYSGLGFTDFTVWINHRQLLTGLIHAAGVPAAQEIPTLITLDKLDKIGRDGVLNELRANGLDDGQLEHLGRLLELQGANEDLLSALEGLAGGHAGALAGIDDLRTILRGLAGARVPTARVRVNPVLARGLSYYTGALFEVTVEGLSSSVGGGGRYDNLVGMFSGRPVPACGFSFGLDRIIPLLSERGLLPVEPTRTQVLVPMYSEEVRDAALELAAELRAEGLRVDVYPEPGKLGTQMQYGTARGIPLAAILGPDELARELVTIRDLATRGQVSVPRSGVVAHLKGTLGG